MVMARSVELGSMSPATCTWAPVDWHVKLTENILIKSCVGSENLAQNCSVDFYLRIVLFAYLSNFFDFAATFPDEGATLASGHHDA